MTSRRSTSPYRARQSNPAVSIGCRNECVGFWGGIRIIAEAEGGGEFLVVDIDVRETGYKNLPAQYSLIILIYGHPPP